MKYLIFFFLMTFQVFLFAQNEHYDINTLSTGGLSVPDYKLVDSQSLNITPLNVPKSPYIPNVRPEDIPGNEPIVQDFTSIIPEPQDINTLKNNIGVTRLVNQARMQSLNRANNIKGNDSKSEYGSNEGINIWLENPKKDPFMRYDTPVDSMYTTLSNGDLVPKYKDYVYGGNNNDNNKNSDYNSYGKLNKSNYMVRDIVVIVVIVIAFGIFGFIFSTNAKREENAKVGAFLLFNLIVFLLLPIFVIFIVVMLVKSFFLIPILSIFESHF